MPASGKTTLAKILAKRLHVQEISAGDILKEMAKERSYKVTGNEWWDTPDGMKFLAEREKNPDFDNETDRRLMDRIAKGDIVVTSYTAPWLSKVGFKVWLEASVENRAKRMSKRDSTDLKEAEEATRARDVRNAKLYKELYGIDFGRDTKPFDMVIDTNALTPDQVADRILAKIKELRLQ